MNLKEDILDPVRQKLLDENQQLFVRPPQNLEANFVKSGGRAKGGAAGTKLQFVAAVPAAVVVGIIGYLGGPRAD